MLIILQDASLCKSSESAIIIVQLLQILQSMIGL